MKTWTKLAMTAGAIGALGIAGSFGTFSAFTASTPDYQSQFKTGSVSVDNAFSMPDASNLATLNPVSAGHITFTNTGTEPQNVWIDFDGPTGNITTQQNSNGTTTPLTDDPLVDNVIVDSSYDADFAHLLDDKTRLFRINNRGLSPLPDPANPTTQALVIAPGASKTLYLRVNLRHRLDGGDDNVNQLKAVTETVHVKAIEAGGTDFLVNSALPAADGGN
jgi:hypothetical protein